MENPQELTTEEQLVKLQYEIKKLRREVKRVEKNNELLRVANEQAARTQSYIQKENQRQIFFNRQLLKTSPYVVIMTDDKLRTVMTSDLYFEFTGVTPEKIKSGIQISEAMAGILDQAGIEDLTLRCQAAMQHKTMITYMQRCYFSDWHVDYKININSMMQDDEVMGLNIVLVDMTEVMESKEKAEMADRAKSSFLANMSHEIRTPINAILGMDEMILRESKETEIVGYADDIKNAGKTLLSLINEILDFSKVEEGKMEIVPNQYDIGTVILDLINMVRDRVEKKGLSFVRHIDPEIPRILYGDEIRIKQCILNLLTNAVKYTSEGSVTLDIGYRRTGADTISLMVRVSDTGNGMREEEVEKLFSPFQRFDLQKNRTVEGTGLGMTITKRLLNLMGGELAVDSVYGKGSDFMFSVEQKVEKWEPLGDYETYRKRDVKQNYHALFRAPEADILVVDDTDINLTVVKSLLKQTEIRVDTALSGKEAIAMAKEKRYDIIFIDHMMPEMDGIETLHAMQIELDYFDHMVPIALTANAISGSRERYIEAGFTDYLSKPVDGQVLEIMIQKYLPAEKVIPYDPSEAEAEGEGDENLPDWLLDIEEIDVQAGVRHCGSSEEYMSVVAMFHRTFAAKTEEIENYYSTENWGDYTTKVHAMKSSLRILGATNLSGFAEGLENAGKDMAIIYIRENHGNFMQALEVLNGKLQIEDEEEDDSNLPEIEPKMLKDAYDSMFEYIQMMDYGMMEMTLEALKEYRFQPEDKAKIAKLSDLLMELEWEKMKEVLQ